VNDFYENSMRYAFGVEHIVGNALPLRIGFRYETSPLDKSIALPTFTMGTGFDILDNLHLDLSGEFSNRNYTALDLFPDSYYDDTQYTEAVDYTSTIWSYAVPTDRGWDNPDKVEETFVKVMTTLSFHW
jgi:long-subunit fatty acid transport protein